MATSLGHLTKKFIALIESTPNGTVNLNDASTHLQVPKRRIYDITNVLEGVGLLNKTSKNTTQWNGASAQPVLSKQQQHQTHLEIAALQSTDKMLEDKIRSIEQEIQANLCSEHAFVTYHDIKSFFDDQTVIAVKAPPDTRLEVSEQLQIWMKSSNGAIEVYLCHNDHNNTETLNNSNHSSDTSSNNHITNTSSSSANSNNNNTNNHNQHNPCNNTSMTTATSMPSNHTTTPQNQPSSSDEGRGRSIVSNTDDPTLSSAFISEDDDPLLGRFVPFEARLENDYQFTLEDSETIGSLYGFDESPLF